jgi:hypothetical protein
MEKKTETYGGIVHHGGEIHSGILDQKRTHQSHSFRESMYQRMTLEIESISMRTFLVALLLTSRLENRLAAMKRIMRP